MPTKTISLDLEAYRRLTRARREPSESFSRVIKRAHWPEAEHTAAALLASWNRLPVADEATIERWDEAQRKDRPPRNKWKSH